jgi:hypothetical protein
VQHWKVRLDDQHGRFWMEADRKWSETIERGQKFTTEREADLAASRARASAAKSTDWFPKIKVVGFK